MRIVDCAQGTHEWFQARCGRVTASEVCDAVSFLKRGDKKGQESKARFDYKAILAAEILSGEPYLDGYLSRDMEHGYENEGFAREAYAIRKDALVEQVGFVIHPTIDRAGASPDGLVGNAGGVEIKCPKTATHIDYLRAGVLPADYEPQVMWCLACTEREWWDFVSFDNRLPLRHQLFITRVHRNEARIKELEDGVRQFLSEVDELIANLEKLNPELSQADRVFGKDRSYITDGITDSDLPGWWRNAEVQA